MLTINSINTAPYDLPTFIHAHWIWLHVPSMHIVYLSLVISYFFFYRSLIKTFKMLIDIDKTSTKIISGKGYDFSSGNAWSFLEKKIVCLLGVLRPTREFSIHIEKSPLLVKGFKFWPMLGTHGQCAVRVPLACHFFILQLWQRIFTA